MNTPAYRLFFRLRAEIVRFTISSKVVGVVGGGGLNAILTPTPKNF